MRVGAPQLSTADLLARIGDQTVASMFVERVRTTGDLVGLRWKDGDGWASMTYEQYGDAVARFAGGLRRLGVRRGDRVVLMMRNIPEFHIIDLACVMLGAVPISIYNSSSPDQVVYLVGHCRGSVAIVEDDQFASRYAGVRPQLPELRTVGTVRGSGDFTYGDLLRSDPIDLDEAVAAIEPDDVVTVIYTSGTTGPPKGVMLTHRQVRFTAESLEIALGIPHEQLAGKRVVSYLPMAHIAERMTSHYNGLLAGYEITTCPNMGAVGDYLRDVHPNIMFGVPRVWEKIHAGVQAVLAADPDKARAFDEAVEAALPIAEARTWGTATDEQLETWQFLDEVAFAPVREAIGLDQLDVAVSSAAPIPSALLAWYRAIGIPLTELYGMSECCGPMTWAPRLVKPGTVGPAIPGVEVRLAPDGEVLCRGGNVFAGYLDDPARTAEAIDDEGWLHSGDIGHIDEDGYLRIIDRKKEIIITAGGKNVSPANLESQLKLVPLVGQAFAIGDRRPYVTALLVLDPEKAAAFAASEGIEYDDLSQLARHPRVLEVISAGVEEAMSHFSHAERVKRFVVLGEEWVPDSDELTPTSKLKRRNIHEKYAAEIESMYAR